MRWTAESAPRFRIDRPIAKALTRAMEEAGIRPSQRARKVGDYKLDELLYEGPTYQDWAATHVALEKERARVRIYVVEPGASEEARASIVKAAKTCSPARRRRETSTSSARSSERARACRSPPCSTGQRSRSST